MYIFNPGSQQAVFGIPDHLKEFCKNIGSQPEGSVQFVRADDSQVKVLLGYSLIKTVKRLTFDIFFQDQSVTWEGDPDAGGYEFVASNGYTVISEKRMDLDTRRVWLHGVMEDQSADRSGSKVFTSDKDRDTAYEAYIVAINEWAEYNGGIAVKAP